MRPTVGRRAKAAGTLAAMRNTPMSPTAGSCGSRSIYRNSADSGAENWAWINFGNQDGQAFPAGAGAESGCDPATYTCFMLLPGDGSVGRVPNGQILDISQWQYYSCPALTQSYRCDPKDNANWTSTFSSRTPVAYLEASFAGHTGAFINPYTVMWLDAFKQYVMTGQQSDFMAAPTLQGPWTMVHRSWPAHPSPIC